MLKTLKNNRWLLLLILFFIGIRIFGLEQYYHQDEYRWVQQVYTEEFGEVDSPHPPVMQTLFSIGGKLFGYDNLRVVPFFFGVLNLLLIFVVSLKLTGNKKLAYFVSGLYLINVYALIASLMIDIDGTLMPFLVLSAYYFYLKAFKDGDKNFMLPLILVLLVGLFTKLSYVLFAGTLAVEYLWTLYDKGKFKYQFKKTALFLGISGVLVVGLYVLYGKADPRFLEYSTNFKYLNFGSRAYLDLGLRLFKFFIWFSPLLFLPMVYGLFKKEIFTKFRIWYIYSLFNFLFYLVIFDFARLPIERYFMFIIIPSVLISGYVVYPFLSRLNKKDLILSLASFLVILVWTALAVHEVVPLNPKEAYINKVKDLDFNFLVPLTGGSGPIGFYGSAMFLLWAWLVCFIGLLLNKKRLAVSLFLVFGIGYNILLSTENLTGAMYGSVDSITKKSVAYVVDNQEINSVVTYYDAGVYYLKMADKYTGRFYTAPSRDYSQRLKTHRGHYMIVDFPAVDKNSLYWELISKCELDKKFTDKYVDSYIFDCHSLIVD
ncbi:MAG: hypothetical protein A3B86_00270 [Candidatus Yanofskybacteria bacterium RIFCSPHIGHO2_02_FULL_38_22b]|uniref:Glycosyltransferase RgtA/B/C/D-like domain-containing protein n=1 Tax=Candidatus Yanofskybacteria bacterium RIFCSPHIGHO2_02_FULL_38_22b TaxID=1802673 RepID=A0A1F8F283_9BACT|nr:MAG: hypothetical protein A2816_00205 [Candidatus Yanofskybacteria bacterium RIFCSPHIGHO2_01_FULL_39_44]OGN06788.1 MAG: hypothetical protein A3B86_00270 [Candidatus Yanofskybacteria bacterium RIFCSPHIGHO2_02_FULL_38_22b]